MPFKQIFERRVNADMQEEDLSNQHAEGSKKERPPTPQLETEAEDADMSEKKDRPPHFSTLFGVAPPLPARQFESYPEPKRKSGIWMPTPLFVLFAVILLFESTLLFAYTIIGLYNNLPSGLVPQASAGCLCESNKPAINISPNFVMPQAQAPVAQTQTITVLRDGLLSDLLPTATSTPPTNSLTSSSTTSASAVDASSQAAAISNVLGMLGGLAFSSTSIGSSSISPVPGVATSTMVLSQIAPPQSTVNSIKLVTVDPSGSTLPPRPTVTSTKVIDASQAAAASSSLAVSVAAESSI